MRLTIGGRVGLFHYDWDAWIVSLLFFFLTVGVNGQIFPCRKVPISIDCARTKNQRRMLLLRLLNRNRNSKCRMLRWQQQQQNRLKNPGLARGSFQGENRWVDWSLIHGLHRICIVDTIISKPRMSSLLQAHGLMRERSRRPTSGTFYPTEDDLMAKQRLPQLHLLVQVQDGEAAWGQHLPVMLDLGVFHPVLTPLSLRLVVDH